MAANEKSRQKGRKALRFAPALSTSDLNLTCALLSMGIPPDPRGLCDPFTGDAGDRVFCHFAEVSLCGRFRTEALMAAWAEGEAWIERNPDHPFSYIMAFIGNRRDAQAAVQGRQPYALVLRGSSVAMIDPAARREVNETLFGLIGI